MAITAADVNKLRQMTGSGMMDCKKALVEADGDFEKAVDILRKKGQKIAAKRADRNANEGYVVAKTNNDHTFGIIVMVNCETDFVGKTADFTNYANTLADLAISQHITSKEGLLAASLNGQSVEATLTEMSGKTGEKVEVNGFACLEKPFISAYNHMGNRLAVIAAFNKACETEAHEIAMQIAAMNPLGVTEKEIPQDVIDRELEVAREQARNEGKPENMIEKIAQGRLNKFYKENTLLHQEFIRDGKMTVSEYMKQADKELTCEGFFRVQLGA